MLSRMHFSKRGQIPNENDDDHDDDDDELTVKVMVRMTPTIEMAVSNVIQYC